MEDGRRAPTGRRSFAARRSSQTSHNVITTAVRRYRSGRAHRDRAVYVAEAFRDDAFDDSYPERRDTARTRVVALSRHDPFSPLASTFLRPLGDAATAIQVLLHR